VKLGGDQIEYEDEDPRIRRMFEEEAGTRGVVSQMSGVYQAAS
jgi:hypothetical protein